MEKADRILSALFERLNISDNEGYIQLFSTWRTVCDEVSSRGLADHSAIVDVRHGTVIVAVDHPGWLQLIQMQEKRLLGKLQHRFPDMGLKAMHFHITRDRIDFIQNLPDSPTEQTRNAPDSASEQTKAPEYSPGVTNDTPRKTSDREPFESEKQREPSEPQESLERISDPKLRHTLERLREDLEDQ